MVVDLSPFPFLYPLTRPIEMPHGVSQCLTYGGILVFVLLQEKEVEREALHEKAKKESDALSRQLQVSYSWFPVHQ